MQPRKTTTFNNNKQWVKKTGEENFEMKWEYFKIYPRLKQKERKANY